MKAVLFLHGAIGSKNQFASLSKMMAAKFEIHTLDFSGHGGAPFNGNFSIEMFAGETLAYLDANGISTIDIFGYSMGGFVALYLARNHPDRVGSIFTLATKFEWTPDIAQREIKMLNAEKIAEKIPRFAAELEKRHAPNDWKTVLHKTADMMIGLGENNPLSAEDFNIIGNRTRIAIGDKDAMVTLEETIAVYRNLSNASFAVLPETQHPIEKVNPDRLAYELDRFFGES